MLNNGIYFMFPPDNIIFITENKKKNLHICLE